MAAVSKASRSPAFIPPMAAQTVKVLPEGEEWLYEVELDGYRALLIKDGERIQIRSRNNKDLTRMYPDGGRCRAALLRCYSCTLNGS